MKKISVFIFLILILFSINLNSLDLYVHDMSRRIYDRGVDVLIIDRDTRREAVYFIKYMNLTDPIDPNKIVWYQLEEPLDMAKRSFPHHEFNQKSYGIIFPYSASD